MLIRCTPWALVCAALLAAPARAEPFAHELSIAASQLGVESFLRPTPAFLLLEVAYHRPAGTEGLWRNLRLGGGLRTSTTAQNTYFPLEAFIEAHFTARIGPWEAAAGPELGLSGFSQLVQQTLLPARELYAKEDPRMGPVYFAFTIAPLRFRVSRFTVSALELRFGANGPPLGPSRRTTIGLVNLGVLL
jgi:hypothetical protein